MPIYSLGSIQDQALHLLLMKEQFVSQKKFENEAALQLISTLMPTVKDSQGLRKLYDNIVEDMSFYINFDEASIAKRAKHRQEQLQNAFKVVDSFSTAEPIQAKINITNSIDGAQKK